MNMNGNATVEIVFSDNINPLDSIIMNEIIKNKTFMNHTMEIETLNFMKELVLNVTYVSEVELDFEGG